MFVGMLIGATIVLLFSKTMVEWESWDDKRDSTRSSGGVGNEKGEGLPLGDLETSMAREQHHKSTAAQNSSTEDETSSPGSTDGPTTRPSQPCHHWPDQSPRTNYRSRPIPVYMCTVRDSVRYQSERK